MSLTDLSFSQICESSPTDQDTLAAVNVRNVWNTVVPSNTWVTYLLPAPLKRKSKEIENSTLKWLAKSLNSASAVCCCLSRICALSKQWPISKMVDYINHHLLRDWVPLWTQVKHTRQQNLAFLPCSLVLLGFKSLGEKVRYTTTITTLVILEYFVCWGGKMSFRHKQ